MKVAIIGDFHFGIKKANDKFLESQINFVTKEFIPYLEQNNIKDIIMLGDFFDGRQHINIKVKNVIFDLFTDILKNFNVHILLGNHDIYYNSSIKIHSLKFFKTFSFVNIIEDIKEISIDNKDLLMVPWQVDLNNFTKYISENCIKSKTVFGHFHINGFNMNKFTVCNDGINGDIFYNNFDLIFSGHFHIRNTQKKNGKEIIYVGAPYHLTRADIGIEKGFCVLDLQTMQYEFINNKTSIKYVEIFYPEQIHKEIVENNIVDININFEDNYREGESLKIQDYVKKIELLNPAFMPTINIINSLNTIDNIKNIEIKGVYDLIQEYVNSLNIENKSKICQILNELYNECNKTII